MSPISSEKVLSPEQGSRRRQIANYFREEIRASRLLPGDQLPPTSELARQLGVGIGSVQWAMGQLAREGLITRCTGSGTVVNARRRELETIGLFFFLAGVYGGNAFNRQLIAEVEKECAARGFRLRLYLENLQDCSVANLLAAYERREFQAAIIVGMHAVIEKQVARLPFPWSSVSATTRWDSRSDGFEQVAARAVKAAGGRHLAYLSGYAPSRKGWRHYRLLERSARRLGLEFSTERDAYWGDETVPPGHVELYQRQGFELMFRLWRDPARRPDSLVVYPDELIPGVLLALPVLGIRVPQDLKLFFHHNAETPMLCPVSCVFIENRIADFARGLVEHCVCQCAGVPMPEMKVVHYARAHQFAAPAEWVPDNQQNATTLSERRAEV